MPRKPSPERGKVSTLVTPIESRLAGVLHHHRVEIGAPATPQRVSSIVLGDDRAVQTWFWGSGAVVVWAAGPRSGFRVFTQLSDAIDHQVRVADDIKQRPIRETR